MNVLDLNEENFEMRESTKRTYRHIVLPNDVAPGDVVQIKYDTEGVVYDLFDNSMEECKEEFGYDLYSDTTIPIKSGITAGDIDEVNEGAYKVVLSVLKAIEQATVNDLPKMLEEVKRMVYEQCPSLLPKNPRKR